MRRPKLSVPPYHCPASLKTKVRASQCEQSDPRHVLIGQLEGAIPTWEGSVLGEGAFDLPRQPFGNGVKTFETFRK